MQTQSERTVGVSLPSPRSWPLRALGLVLACGLVSAVVYQGAVAAFGAVTKTPSSKIVSLDPVTLTTTTQDDTTTFDVPGASGTYPTVKCMPITYTPVTGTPVLVRPFVPLANQPAGPLDPRLKVTIEFGASSASAYNCGSFQPGFQAYSGTWSQFLAAHRAFDTAPDAGTISNAPRTWAARVTFTLIDPGNPPARGVMSRVVLSFGARSCAAGSPLPCLTKPLYYLKTSTAPPLPGDLAGLPALTFPLSATAPAYDVLYNYDVGRNTQPGLTVARGGHAGDLDKEMLRDANYDNQYQRWVQPQDLLNPPPPLTLSNTTHLRLWSSLRDFKAARRGSATVKLYDCAQAPVVTGLLSLDCVPVPNSTVTITADPWDANCAVAPCPWREKTWAFPSNLLYTINPNRMLGLIITVEGSEEDMQFAYDTTTYRSRFEG